MMVTREKEKKYSVHIRLFLMKLDCADIPARNNVLILIRNLVVVVLVLVGCMLSTALEVFIQVGNE